MSVRAAPEATTDVRSRAGPRIEPRDVRSPCRAESRRFTVHGSAIPADGIDVRIEATLVGDDLRIVIARRGKAEEAASSQLALTELRGRLRDLYGDAASLTVGTAAGDAQAVLVLPRTLEPVGEPSAMPEERVGAPDITFDPAYQGA